MTKHLKYRSVYRGVTTDGPNGRILRLYAIEEWGGVFWHTLKPEGKAPLLKSQDAADRYVASLQA